MVVGGVEVVVVGGVEVVVVVGVDGLDSSIFALLVLAPFSPTIVQSSVELEDAFVLSSSVDSFSSVLSSEVDGLEDSDFSSFDPHSEVSTCTYTSIPNGSRAAATKLPTFFRPSAEPAMVANCLIASLIAS